MAHKVNKSYGTPKGFFELDSDSAVRLFYQYCLVRNHLQVNCSTYHIAVFNLKIKE